MMTTVSICTWNRDRLLDQTLAEMRRLRIPPGVDWELIVVNNNCTDDTDAVIARHQDHLPLRRVFEPLQGHSNSRNRAIREARGELLIWTDDDVLVHEDWLSEYVGAARCWPQASYFGGTIEPWFEIDPPAWIERNFSLLEHAYAIRRFGDDVGPMGPKTAPFGANMAFRTEVLKEFRFDPQFGLNGNNAIRGDETELFERLRRLGHQGIWVGTAKVRHFIPAERLTYRYIWDWHRGKGRTDVRTGPIPDCPLFLGLPRWVLRQICQSYLTSVVLTPLKNRRWVQEARRAAYLLGMIDEIRSRRQITACGSLDADSI